MNLTIDIGNSSSKTAIFNNNEIIISKIYNEFADEQLMELYDSYKFKNVIYFDIINSFFRFFRFICHLINSSYSIYNKLFFTLIT